MRLSTLFAFVLGLATARGFDALYAHHPRAAIAVGYCGHLVDGLIIDNDGKVHEATSANEFADAVKKTDSAHRSTENVSFNCGTQT